MINCAVYPGTFDPITLGHFDLIQRASLLFDRFIVAVAEGVHKNPQFALDERIEVCRDAVVELSHVEVLPLSGLLINFAREHDARCIIRGLRAVSDFDYEFQLAGMNRRMEPDIETLFLPAGEAVQYVSSTMVREIVQLGGDVSSFVPKAVMKRL